MNVEILIGDVRKRLLDLPEKHFQAVITSPPYWGLRDYNHPDQLGLEPDPREYLRHMVEIFRMIRPKLRDDGTLWVNMGDCYVTGTSAPHKSGQRGSSQNTQDAQNAVPRNGYPFDLAPKNLVMMPARLALALQDDGWILRSDIIWEKPNPMPESVYDRPTTSHEHVYLFSKGARYFYDFEAAKEPVSPNTHKRMAQDIEGQAGSERANGGTRADRPMKAVLGGVNPKARENPRSGEEQAADAKRAFDSKVSNRSGARQRIPSGWDTREGHSGDPRVGRYAQDNEQNPSYSAAVVDTVHDRNMRTVWKIPTAPFKGAHFATYPPALVIKCLTPATGAQACELCGASWVTVALEREPTGGRESGNAERQYRAGHGGNPDAQRGHQGFGFPWEPTATTATERRPTCKCEGAKGTGRAKVLDPFGGAGTTGLVCSRMNRDCTLIELNKKYAKLAAHRIHDDAPLFAASLAGVVAEEENSEAVSRNAEPEHSGNDSTDLLPDTGNDAE